MRASRRSQALLDPVEYCDLDPEIVEDVVTPGLVAAALQVIPLPPSELQVQPANGRTLVNFETNFFTENAPFDRTVTLLGQRVDLHIVPSEFAWRFGDGEVLATTDAGAPYPDLVVTHDYQRKGRVRPAVDTTYTATYRVNGGPWADVPGSVTIPGAPVGLQVLTATPVLVGADQLEVRMHLVRARFRVSGQRDSSGRAETGRASRRASAARPPGRWFGSRRGRPART